MTIEITQTLTSTGAGDTIDIGEAKVTSFAMTSNNADAVVDIEVLLTAGGAFKKEKIGVAEATVFVTISPIKGIRANVTGLGTSTTVTFEVLGISR